MPPAIDPISPIPPNMDPTPSWGAVCLGRGSPGIPGIPFPLPPLLGRPPIFCNNPFLPPNKLPTPPPTPSIPPSGSAAMH